MFEQTKWDKFLDKIGYWPVYRFFKEVRRRIRWTPFFIKKVWDYTKLLWNDWDFDYLCLLRLIELKTRRTREYLVDEKMVHVDERRMKEVEYLARRIFEDNYFPEEWDEYLSQLHMKSVPCTLEGFEDLYELKINHDDPDHEWKRKYLHEKTERLKQNEIDRLFYLIRKYLQVWWS